MRTLLSSLVVIVLLFPAAVQAQVSRGAVVESLSNERSSFAVRVDVDRRDRTYARNDLLRATVTSSEDGYLYLFYRDAQGNTTVLFPNNFQKDNQIRKGETVTVPAEGSNFRIRIDAPFGDELLKAVVAKRPLQSADMNRWTQSAATPLQDKDLIAFAKGLVTDEDVEKNRFPGRFGQKPQQSGQSNQFGRYPGQQSQQQQQQGQPGRQEQPNQFGQQPGQQQSPFDRQQGQSGQQGQPNQFGQQPGRQQSPFGQQQGQPGRQEQPNQFGQQPQQMGRPGQQGQPNQPDQQPNQFGQQNPYAHQTGQQGPSNQQAPTNPSDRQPETSGQQPQQQQPQQQPQQDQRPLSQDEWAEHQVRIQTIESRAGGSSATGAAQPTGQTDQQPQQQPSQQPPSGQSDGQATGTMKGDRFAIGIGVSNYKDDNINNLGICHVDADRMMEIFQKRCGVKKENSITLNNEKATLENVRKVIKETLPKTTKPGDTVFIFWSGHGGQTDDKKKEYLIPYDAKGGEESSVLMDETFGRWLQDLDGRKILIVIDACHSGGMARNAKTLSKALDEDDKDWRPLRFAFTQLAVMKDIGQKDAAVIASSTSSEVSYVRKERDLSVLTYYLLQAFDQSKEPLTHVKWCDSVRSEVQQYVNRNFSGKKQTVVMQDEMTEPLVLNP